ncbi:MAG: EscU/YscU/HrcU family type III secretion system export apparatus switch protein [Pseudomonadota bacterium]
MSSDDNSAEKTHLPTERRLKEARRKGDTAKSSELASAAVYFGFAAACALLSLQALFQFFTTLSFAFQGAQDPSLIQSRLWAYFISAIIPIAPLVLLPMILNLATYVVQGSIQFAPEKIAFDLKKISPIKNFSQRFSKLSLTEFTANALKASLFVVFAFFFLQLEIDNYFALLHMEAHSGIGFVAAQIFSFICIGAFISTIFGLIDFMIQRYFFISRNMMSRTEFEDDTKESEGDAKLKSRRIGFARDLVENGVRARVAGADVVIVNPRHYAVALTWDQNKLQAPLCVVKGVDRHAMDIRALAEQLEIPVYYAPAVARAIYRDIPIDSEIHFEHFRSVAAAIRFSDRIRGKKRSFTEQATS